MQAVASLQVTRPAVLTRTSRKSVVVKASAHQVAPKQKAAIAGLVALAAAVLVQLPVPSADAADVKSVVCASNPTSKLCLKDSAKK